jgi:hypothetical protein
MSDTEERGCGRWHWPHVCRLPEDHAGDHRCVGCGDVWNPWPDDDQDDFGGSLSDQNLYDVTELSCEDELGRQYTVPETPEEQRRARLMMGALAHDAVTTTRGVRGHQPGRDRTGEPPCEICDAIDQEAAALGVTWQGATR